MSSKFLEWGSAILSILVLPLVGWVIKLESDRAVLAEKVTQLESSLEKKVGGEAFRTRISTVDKAFTETRRQIEIAQGIKKDLVVIKVTQGRAEEKIDGIKSDLAALKRLVLAPVPR